MAKKLKFRSEAWKQEKRKSGKWYFGKNRDRKKDEVADMESKEGFSKTGKRGFTKKITQEGSSGPDKVVDTGDSMEIQSGNTPEKSIQYKKRGSEDNQQAVETTTDQDGNTTYEKQEVKTKGGTFKEFGKDSKKAGSFRDAFATASKSGKDTFMWNGLKYSTKKK